MAPLRSLLRHAGASRQSANPLLRKSKPLRLELLETRLLPAQNVALMATPLVNGLYHLLLDRAPQPAENSGWVTGLETGTLTPAQVATGFLGSREFNIRAVDQQYIRLLDRAPEAGVAQTWMAQMQASGGSEPLTVGILSSPEYYAAHGGDSQSWLTAVYHDLLDRAPD